MVLLKLDHKGYPCEACQGLIPEMRRTKCLGCGRYYCDHHIDSHNCKDTPSPLIKDIDPDFLSLYGVLTKEAILSMLWDAVKDKWKVEYGK